MSGRIVLFGATGYTGRLTAEALVERGSAPILAGRSAGRLQSMAARLGGLETRVADVAEPRSVRAMVQDGEVLVSTVGPFVTWGQPAVRAAMDAGVPYLDSSGEPPFIRQVFERFGPQSRTSGLVTAFGYDWVPGNLAGALALARAGPAATRVEIGYFTSGPARPSGGTLASAAGVLLEPSFAFRGGRLRTERSAARVRRFEVLARSREAVSVGATEHFTLPRLHPSLRTVDVYLGWLGSASRAAQVLSLAGSGLARIPGTRAGARAVAGRFAKGSTGGPDPEARARSRSHIVAIATADDGAILAEVRLDGIDGYTFTARILAWGAMRAAQDGLSGTGALGPVEAFGLEDLRRGVEEAGLRVTGPP